MLDGLRTGCDQGENIWTVGIDSTVVRAHQHAAGARHAPPAARLAGVLEGVARPWGHTGGATESQEPAAGTYRR